MVKLNNAIPNGHFHKDWQRYLKTWFNQPMQKRRRKVARKMKAIRKLPMPVEYLRPIVHCPSVRYHIKIKPGRGFTLHELKKAGINKHFARTIGIAVDRRRMNKSVEGMCVNVQRLKEYYSKLIVFPQNKKKQREELKQPIKTITTAINKLIRVRIKSEKARVPSDEEKKFSARQCTGKARADAKYYGIRLKRKKMSKEPIDPLISKPKKGRRQPDDD